MSLHETIRARIAEAVRRRQRGEPDLPVDGDPGIVYRDPAAPLLRAACVECTVCYCLVARGSTGDHTAEHLRAALAVEGAPGANTFIASAEPPDPA